MCTYINFLQFLKAILTLWYWLWQCDKGTFDKFRSFFISLSLFWFLQGQHGSSTKDLMTNYQRSESYVESVDLVNVDEGHYQPNYSCPVSQQYVPNNEIEITNEEKRVSKFSHETFFLTDSLSIRIDITLRRPQFFQWSNLKEYGFTYSFQVSSLIRSLTQTKKVKFFHFPTPLMVNLDIIIILIVDRTSIKYFVSCT